MRRDDWETPTKLYIYLHRLFNFTVDAAASKNNALCNKFWSEEDSALEKDWSKERVFCNPPYSMSAEFANYALCMMQTGCLLLPVRTDRLWYQSLVEEFKTCYITGRLHFGKGINKSAFMYSVLVYNHPDGKILPNYFQAGQFNDNGKGDAKS